MKPIITFFLLTIFNTNLYCQLNMELASHYEYDQRIADVWGWFNPIDEKEYAIVGIYNGISIVEVTNPQDVSEVSFLSGLESRHRDIKTFKNYAYVSNETGDGIKIIDLQNLPDSATSIQFEPYFEDFGDTLKTVHNLFVDEFGYLFVCGSNLHRGGVLYFDLNNNPLEPKYVGKGPSISTHDIYVKENRLYSSEIAAGRFAIYDIENKDTSILLGQSKTPFQFTHNTWLSDDTKTLFTTDEQPNASVASYDISDLDDINLLDEFRPNATKNTGLIPHNVHVWQNWLVISYYTDGGIIVDATRPDNLIEVGNFDTFFGVEKGFFGVWGAYPFLPSKTCLLSDIFNGLFVTTPNYVQACWLEGIVTDSLTNLPLQNVSIEIQSDLKNLEFSNPVGIYKTGIAIAGTYEVKFSKAGYERKSITVDLENGKLTNIDIQLKPASPIRFNGIVKNRITGMPVPNSIVFLQNDLYAYSDTTDANGNYSIFPAFADSFDLKAGAWGMRHLATEVIHNAIDTIELQMMPGYQDDFFWDWNWRDSADQAATTGFWEMGEPIGTNLIGGALANPEYDIENDFGTNCYMTGNGGGNRSTDDVDRGIVTLISPEMDLSSYNFPVLEYQFWYINEENQTRANDTLVAKLLVDTTEYILDTTTFSASSWRQFNINLDSFDLSKNCKFILEAGDIPAHHVIEAAIDGFLIIDLDSDGDGFLEEVDCDDLNATINPDAAEIPNNSVDENCDGIALIIDEDMDGFNSDEDCDDFNPSINPNAVEIPNNGIDEDCDGMDLIISSTENSLPSFLKISPNPFSDKLFIANDSDHLLNFQIFDTTGKLLFDSNFSEKEKQITTSFLDSGLYFSVILNKKTGERWVSKLIRI